jgi:hypothetical protein
VKQLERIPTRNSKNADMNDRTTSAASGTLILVIPTAEGLVVAADSRTRLRGKFYDCREKLHVAGTRAPFVFAITGSGEFPCAIPHGIDPEPHLRDGPYAFRGRDAVLAYCERNPDFVISCAGLELIGQGLATGYSEFLARHPTKADECIGQCICRVVLCQVDPVGGELLIASIAIAIDADRRASPTAPTFHRVTSTDAAVCLFFGEVGYVVEHVENGAGRRFVPPDAESLWASMGLVRDLRAHQAVRLAVFIVKAAEQISAEIPLPSGNGIGGPVRTLLVTATAVVPL